MKKIAVYKGWALACASDKTRFLSHRNGCPFVFSSRDMARRTMKKHGGIIRVRVMVEIEQVS